MKQVQLPDDSQITPLNSIVIIAKPKHVYVAQGVTLAQESANLILPTMYIKKGISINRNALYMLNLAPFFRPVDFMYKRQPKSVDILVEEY